MAWAPMLDLESKLAESGLGTAHIHESKDFSHGRFILVMKEQRASIPKIMVHVGPEDPYESYLQKTLEKKCRVISLSTTEHDALGALEILIKVQFLVQKIGEVSGLDISRPASIPSAGLRLYRWRQSGGRGGYPPR